MSSQKVIDVIFENEFRMKFGPVMGGPDESQNEIQMLQAERTQSALQDRVRPRGVGALEKNVRCAGKQRLFSCAVGFRKRRDGRIESGADRQMRQQSLSGRKRAPQQSQYDFHAL